MTTATSTSEPESVSGPANPVARRVWAYMRRLDAPTPATKIARGLGVAYAPLLHVVKALEDDGWAVSRTEPRPGWTFGDSIGGFRALEHHDPRKPEHRRYPDHLPEPTSYDPAYLPRKEQRAALALVQPKPDLFDRETPPPPTPQRDVVAEVLAAQARRDPIGTALALATVEQLRAELARREAGGPLLPPEE